MKAVCQNINFCPSAAAITSNDDVYTKDELIHDILEAEKMIKTCRAVHCDTAEQAIELVKQNINIRHVFNDVNELSKYIDQKAIAETVCV